MSSTLRSEKSGKKSRFSLDPRIKPYEFNTLKGRYIHIAAKSPEATRTFVVLYGHHATLERILPIAETLSEFGDVYMPDNPGFGGMDPSYKIGRHADLEFFSDNLKHFIDEYVAPDRHLTVLGISFGFQIAVEFLQRFPEYRHRVETLVSFAGFVSPENISMSPPMKVLFRDIMGRVAKSRLGAGFYGMVINDFTITRVYKLTWKRNVKFDSIPKEAVDEYIAGQVWLWRASDHRTHGRTGYDFFGANELSGYRFDDVRLIHVGIPRDHFLNNASVEQKLRRMFAAAETYTLDLPNHGPLDLDSPDKIRPILPQELIIPLKTSRNMGAVTED